MKVPVRIYKMSGGGGQYDVPQEFDVTAWFKREGDRVNKGEELFEFESDKAVVPFLAPVAGVLVDIAYPIAKGKWIRGEAVLPLGDPIFYDPPFCWIETDEIDVARVLPKPHPDSVSPTQDKHASVIATHSESRKKRPRTSAGPFLSIEEARKAKPRMSIGALRLLQEEKVSFEELFDFFGGIVGTFTEYHIKNLLEKRDADVQSQRDFPLTSDPVRTNIAKAVPFYRDFAVTSDPVQSEAVKAVPLARTIAREKGIDLAHVSGTGPEGLVLASDVEKRVDVKEIRSTHAIEEISEERILLSMPRLWRTIAANMEAAIRMPTADVRVESRRFNLCRLTEFYRANRASIKKITKQGLWLPLMVAYARVLRSEPFILFNSCWHEEVDSTGKVIPYIAARKYVHMGIAYDRGEAPVIDWENKTIQGERLRILAVRNIHSLSLRDIITEVERLFAAALQKRFSLQDTSGYTAIFNNIGVLGHHSGRALLTQGIASELNMGSVDGESGEAVIQLVLDHRLIDGAMTTSFFRALYKELMQCVLPELEMFLEKK